MIRAAALIAVAASMPALAQMPPGKWWRDPSMVRDIGLTERQQSDIEALFVAARDRLIDLRAQVEKAEGALQDAFDTEPFQEARAAAAVDAREKARGELIKAEVGLQIGIRKILGREQFERLKMRRPPPPQAPRSPHAPEPPRPPEAPLPPAAAPEPPPPPRM